MCSRSASSGELFFSSRASKATQGQLRLERLLNGTETCKSGKRSEEQIKIEALRFFLLTSADQSKDKKLFKKALESLMKANINQINLLQKEARKIQNGKGGNYEIPPEDFCPDIRDENNGRQCYLNSAEKK